MAVDSATLAKLEILKSLSPATLTQLASALSLQSSQAGAILFEQGDMASGLYLLKQGYVILYRQSKERAQILAVTKAGQYFGGESLPNQTPCPYTAKTITPSMCYYLPAYEVRVLLQEAPDFLAFYLELISRRLRQLTTLVHNLAFHDVTSRLAGVLLSFAEADGELTNEGLRIPKVLSQKELAAMVGTAREVVYRTLKHFEESHLLETTRSHYIILDVDEFARIAAQESH
jgi:CRP/FNR family transcriptional regulator